MERPGNEAHPHRGGYRVASPPRAAATPADAPTHALEREALVARLSGWTSATLVLMGLLGVLATPFTLLVPDTLVGRLVALFVVWAPIAAIVLLRRRVAAHVWSAPLREVEGTLSFDGRRWWLVAGARSYRVPRMLLTPLTIGPGRGYVFPWIPIALSASSSVPDDERLAKIQTALDAHFGGDRAARDALAAGRIPPRIAGRLRGRSRFLAWCLALTATAVAIGIALGSAPATVDAAFVGAIVCILSWVTAPPGAFEHPSRLHVEEVTGRVRAHARYERRAGEMSRVELLSIGARSFETPLGFARVLAPDDRVRAFVSVPGAHLLAVEVLSRARDGDPSDFAAPEPSRREV